jgi:hypothetical protein
VLRFIHFYEQRDATEFSKLLTGDFTFEFSSAADPELAQKYSEGWFKDDEVISTRNLFEGGTAENGVFLVGALRIRLTLTPTAPADDNSPGRDPDLYKTLVASIHLVIDLPGDDDFVVGEAPPQTNRFFLVRGDAAVGLEADQPADENHWYIWSWRDESLPIGKPQAPLQNESSTWGRVKGQYR